MFLLELALQRRTFLGVLTATLTVFGIVAFFDLGRLEDPEFTIKTAVVFVDYPGATAEEVEGEVTEHLESAIQELGEVDDVISTSRPGRATILVELKDTAPQDEIPQVWDELRRKIADATPGLPPGAYPPLVVDDYGDVFGAYYAVYGDGYSLGELKDIVDDLRTELLTVDGVASVEKSGAPVDLVNVSMGQTRLAELGVTPAKIFQTLEQDSAVTPAGRIRAGRRDVELRVAGTPRELEELRSLIVRGRGESLVRLGDVAEVGFGQEERPGQLMFYNGQPAVGFGVSTVEGGNVVDTGQRIQAKLDALQPRLPLGIEIGPISVQAETVQGAVNSFLVNLAEAVAIVVGLLLLFMGFRSGVIVGGVLILTIVGTFIFMSLFGIALQRISLGALVIALGMLVDNTIVVVEGMLVRIQKGEDSEAAARTSVKETMWPLLGATGVAILAFAAISLSPDSAGEFLASLFQVIAISLLLSWVLAVTITPLAGILFLKPSKSGLRDPYDTPFFTRYRRLLATLLRNRMATLGAVTLLLVLSFVGFAFVEQNFFPNSARPQFMVEMWRSQGSHIEDTAEDAQALSEFSRSLEGVAATTSLVGSGALRFILTYTDELPNPSYAQVLVSVDDADTIDSLQEQVRAWARENLKDTQVWTKRFTLGTGSGAKIEARFSGLDPEVLRGLGERATAIMLESPEVTDIRHDWRNRVPVLTLPINAPSLRRTGVSREGVAQGLAVASSGTIAGLHRYGEELLPIRLRLLSRERPLVDIESASVWSAISGRALPVRQVVGDSELELREGLIKRRNRARTLTVQGEPVAGTATAALASIRDPVESLELPSGYRLEWGGEYESSGEANAMLLANVPVFLVLMFLIVVGLFNAIRTPVIVFATLPLALIGVTFGLLVFNKPFGFVALLGFLSLSGMLIKNAIVLIEQINIYLNEGRDAFDAIVEAGVTRVRPVAMAAFTTVLGMIPLLSDVFFDALAVTIMGGLAFATLLTLLVVPVLYATAFRTSNPPQVEPTPS
ncbi:MAG: efflux RND transporter permease subunit [Myxococcota bacterium]